MHLSITFFAFKEEDCHFFAVIIQLCRYCDGKVRCNEENDGLYIAPHGVSWLKTSDVHINIFFIDISIDQGKILY